MTASTPPHGSSLPARVRWGPRIAYLGVILLATLPPPVFDLSREGLLSRLSGAFDPTFVGGDVVDAARNLLLFAGWGAVWAATARPWRTRGDRGRSILAATLTGAAISVTMEGIQLLSPYRDTSMYDLLFNTVGGLLGAAVLVGLIRVVERFQGARSFVGMPAFVFAGAYGIAVALEAFIPLLEQRLIPGSGGGVGDRALRAFEYFSWGTLFDVPLHHVPIFLPAGVFAVAAQVEAGTAYATALRRVLWWGFPAFLAVEILGGIAGHPIVAGAVLTHALSVALGAWLAVRFLPTFTRRFRGRRRPLLLLGAYLSILAIWTWRPFTLVTSFEMLRDGVTFLQFRPLLAHAVRFDLFSVTDITRQFALLLPVGALMAAWPVRERGMFWGPLPGVYAAVLLEGGQMLVDGRLFDMTDAVVGASGVLLGWVAVRRAGTRPWGELWPRGGSPSGRPRSARDRTVKHAGESPPSGVRSRSRRD